MSFVMSDLSQIRDKVLRRVGQRDEIQLRLNTLQQQKEQSEQDSALVADARKLLEIFVKSTEHNVQGYIEPIVTEALDFVFNQGLFFHLLFVNRRNQVEIDFIVIRDTDTEAQYQEYRVNPEKSAKKLEQLVKETKNLGFMYGGAVNQVLGLILRIVLVELLHIHGPIVLDEPSSAVGEEYSTRLGQLLTSLSKRFNRQILLITHSKSLASFADITYEVGKLNNISQIKEIENV
jgi:DNA repair exonuclease SbcCD ATPase subunit